MATVTVDKEEEFQGGWMFEVTVRDGPGRDGPARGHRVTLAWVDYEHWSHGRLAPERVVQRVVTQLLASGMGQRLPDRFDAATARRWVKGFDQLMGDDGSVG